jgi:hypothetical protein
VSERLSQDFLRLGFESIGVWALINLLQPAWQVFLCYFYHIQ